MKEEKTEYAVLLRQARTSHKMTQVEVATQLRVSRGAVSNWEKGIRRPSVESLEQWLKVFGLKLVVDFIDKKHEKDRP